MQQVTQNRIKDVDIQKLDPQNLENIFTVFRDAEINGNYAYNLIRGLHFPTDLDPTLYDEYTARPSDAWTLIAHTFYNDVRLWWLIAAVNNVTNPLLFPVPGVILKILKPNVVRSVLATLQES